MSDSQQTSWSNDPNAPNVSYPVYHYEKTYFAGIFIGSALYGIQKAPLPTRPSVLTLFVWFILGIIIVLFFRCMVALLDPVHRRGERIKWGLVSYTMVMFSLVTIGNAVYPYLESISYIDNREFSGIEGVVGPGPLAYQMFVAPIVLQIIPNVSFTLSNWLADGLLVSYLCDLHSLIHVSNIGSSSSIVVTLSTPRTSGSSPSPVSCTLVRLVRVFEFSMWCQHYGLTSST